MTDSTRAWPTLCLAEDAQRVLPDAQTARPAIIAGMTTRKRTIGRFGNSLMGSKLQERVGRMTTRAVTSHKGALNFEQRSQ